MGESRRRRFAVVSFDDSALDRLSKADEHFFARTGRRHRLRLAGRAEIDTLVRIHGPQAAHCLPGERLFAVVRVPFDGAHLKAFLPNKVDAEVDVPEALVSALFDRLSSRGPELGVLEGTMRSMVEEGRH